MKGMILKRVTRMWNVEWANFLYGELVGDIIDWLMCV